MYLGAEGGFESKAFGFVFTTISGVLCGLWDVLDDPGLPVSEEAFKHYSKQTKQNDLIISFLGSFIHSIYRSK